MTWTLSRTANGTRLRLVHAGFVMPKNDSAFKTMGKGWKKVVPSLGAIAATGLTGTDPRPNTRSRNAIIRREA